MIKNKRVLFTLKDLKEQIELRMNNWFEEISVIEFDHQYCIKIVRRLETIIELYRDKHVDKIYLSVKLFPINKDLGYTKIDKNLLFVSGDNKRVSLVKEFQKFIIDTIKKGLYKEDVFNSDLRNYLAGPEIMKKLNNTGDIFRLPKETGQSRYLSSDIVFQHVVNPGQVDNTKGYFCKNLIYNHYKKSDILLIGYKDSIIKEGKEVKSSVNNIFYRTNSIVCFNIEEGNPELSEMKTKGLLPKKSIYLDDIKFKNSTTSDSYVFSFTSFDLIDNKIKINKKIPIYFNRRTDLIDFCKDRTITVDSISGIYKIPAIFIFPIYSEMLYVDLEKLQNFINKPSADYLYIDSHTPWINRIVDNFESKYGKFNEEARKVIDDLFNNLEPIKKVCELPMDPSSRSE